MSDINYQSIIEGDATGDLLVSDTGLSFWGGVNPVNGLIIDQHHPLHNHSVSGKILALPSGRGSSSGSGAILELLLNKAAPAALIFIEPEDILTLGIMVSEVLFERRTNYHSTRRNAPGATLPLSKIAVKQHH